MRVAKALFPTDVFVDDAEYKEAAVTEWKREIGSRGRMIKIEFMDSVFEIADIWTEQIDADA
jgi:hypothetical protein